MSSSKIAIALLFRQVSYIRGIDDVINLINSQFPNNDLTLEKYLIDGTQTTTESALSDFLQKYPTDRKCTISERTIILTHCSNYFTNLLLNIPSFSVSATSPSVKTLNNVLTYAPFDTYSSQSIFLIFVKYNMKQFKILYDAGTTDEIFFQTYISEVNQQAQFLNIPVDVDVLQVDKTYNFTEKTHIILLCTSTELKNKYITSNFLEQIPPNCYLTLTDASDDCPDIFGEIPSMVILPVPINYTTTTQLVYSSTTGDKNNLFYGIYPFYDCLYTLNFIANTDMPLTMANFLSVNPFQDTLQAWSNALVFDQSINGTQYGKYLAIFTKDVIVGNDTVLYNTYNTGGGLSYLPESQSTFRMIGIVPFFESKIYYNGNDYYKIYDTNGNLQFVGYDFSIVNFNGLKVNTGTTCNVDYLYQFNDEGYLTHLQNIRTSKNDDTLVNSTMSKTPIIKYIESENPQENDALNAVMFAKDVRSKKNKITLRKYHNKTHLNKITTISSSVESQKISTKEFLDDWDQYFFNETLNCLITGFCDNKKMSFYIITQKPQKSDHEICFDILQTNGVQSQPIKLVNAKIIINDSRSVLDGITIAQDFGLNIYSKLCAIDDKYINLDKYNINSTVSPANLIDLWKKYLKNNVVLANLIGNRNHKPIFYAMTLSNPFMNGNNLIFTYSLTQNDSEKPKEIEIFDEVNLVIYSPLSL